MKVLISAGPTREYFDAVRFISNPSSGKMGIEIAREFSKLCETVLLLSKAVDECRIPKGIKIVRFETAKDLLFQIERWMKEIDILVMTAAVSDFRPARCYRKKLKKEEFSEIQVFKKNPDILKRMTGKFRDKFFVGFCAETDNLKKNALAKLNEKSLDIIVANKVYKSETGFSSDYNKVVVFEKGKERELAVFSGKKKYIAKNLTSIIINAYLKKRV